MKFFRLLVPTFAILAGSLTALATPEPFIVAGLKIVPALGDKDANFAKMERHARLAAANGAKFIITCEGFLDGYYGNLRRRPNAREVLLGGLAETVDGPYVRKAAALARELSVYLLFGFSERRGDRLFNTIAVLTPQGEVAGTYSKSHVDRTESYEPGTEFPVFSTEHGTFGVLVCYDRQLPETSRLLALKGAEFILVPEYSENVDLINEDLMMRVRAYENNVFVVLNGPFNSLAADPSGELIARSGPESGETIVYSTIDLGKRDPEGGPIARRHPEYYGPLSNPNPPTETHP
jgi:predicted amidohydrolase